MIIHKDGADLAGCLLRKWKEDGPGGEGVNNCE